MNEMLSDDLAVLRRAGIERADLLLTLGSGQANPWPDQVVASLSWETLPGWPAVEVAGHRGRLSLVNADGRLALVMEGRRHYYEARSWEGVLTPLRTAARLGARLALLTNSAGALQSDLGPGALVAASGHLMLDDAGLASVLAELGDAPAGRLWWPQGRRRMRAAARASGVALTEGVLWYSTGPTYETGAEARMARRLGADVAAMSLVPEARIAAALGLWVVGVSLVTNRIASPGVAGPTHEEVLAVARRYQDRLDRLLQGSVGPLMDDLDTVSTGDEAGLKERP
jgi:purine-nucleoside phosphorylase